MDDNAGLEPVPIAAHDGILALFNAAPVVALGEAHWLDQQHRLIRERLFDERFIETVDAVVVEFGNALYQPLMDHYLAGGDVAASQLRRVWSECVGGWFSRAFESPVYAEFFETVRSVRRARRTSEGSLKHVEVFPMDSVRTPIIGRPRPLPSHRRAHHAHALATPCFVKSL
jgi:hypothetical protein